MKFSALKTSFAISFAKIKLAVVTIVLLLQLNLITSFAMPRMQTTAISIRSRLILKTMKNISLPMNMSIVAVSIIFVI